MPWNDARQAEHAAMLACDAATLEALGRDSRAASETSGMYTVQPHAPGARSRYPERGASGRAREWAGLLATQEAETQALRQEVDLLRAQVRDAKCETAVAERRAAEAEEKLKTILPTLKEVADGLRTTPEAAAIESCMHCRVLFRELATDVARRYEEHCVAPPPAPSPRVLTTSE